MTQRSMFTRSDLSTLTRILGYRRAPGTASYAAFIRDMIEPVFGPAHDAIGNYVLSIPTQIPSVGTEAPTLAFVAHLDTVEVKDGRTILDVDHQMGFITLSRKDTTSRCLGADCGAGIFLILEMIRHKVPGLYILCAEEETGMHGANVLSRQSPHLFQNIVAAIEFDRHDASNNQVITRMSCGQTCSDTFAEALCDTLGMGYIPSDDGLATDVVEFIDLVPNCTNITVGYRDHHTRRESLDFFSLFRLRDVLVSADFSAVIAAAMQPYTRADKRRVYTDWDDTFHSTDPMEEIILNHPAAIAALLLDLGFDQFDLTDMIYDHKR